MTPTEPPPPIAEKAGQGETKTAMVAPEEKVAPPAPAPVETVPPAAEEPAENGPPAAADVGAEPPPSFDIVRVEPTGDAVVAGQAEPGATVELMSDGKPIATAEANELGEWALALLEPLPPGSHDLAIRTTSPDKKTVALSDQRVAVMVPEKPTEAPLVVLNTPDAPSTIVQLPESPAEPAKPTSQPEETVIASAPAATPAPEEKAAAPAPEGAAAPLPAETPKEPAMAAVAPEEPPAVEPAPEVKQPTPPPAGPAAAPQEAAAPAATPEEKAVAVAEPPPSKPADITAPPPKLEPQIVPEVAVTAVEAETTGALYIAGTATMPQNVRVYMDDKLLGEAKPSPSGTWLLQVQRDLPAGTYAVRADQVDGTSGAVLARAEVPFEREVEVATLKPVGEAGGPAGASVSGSVGDPQTVIIKRSDNLWRISRELYGKGIRWSTIYQANKDQIRSPHWIYPGQVFVLPEGNAAWQDDAKN